MIRTKLKDHQETIVDFVAPKPYAGIFAGYGLGKSLCALSIIDRNGWDISLIVSTKISINTTWPEQISEHTDFFYVKLIGSSKEKFRIIQNAFERFSGYSRHQMKPVIFLINFEGVKNLFAVIAAIKPKAVFLDESMRIKSASTIRTQVMWALGRTVKNRYLMTGFPVTENLTEVYSQVKYLDNGATFGNSYKAFLDEYFDKKSGKWTPKPGAAKEIFDKIKDFCIMVPDTIIKLPPAVYKKIALKPYDRQRELLDQIRNEGKAVIGNVHLNITSIYALLTKSLQVCDGFIFDRNGKPEYFPTPKDEALIKQLQSIDVNEKVLIFTTFVPTIVKLQRILTKFGYGVLTLYGKTEDPNSVVRAFQNSPRYRVMIASIFSADASITLTASNHGMYYSHWWSNDKKGNSKARIRRIGSEIHDSIFYTEFFLKGTIEELVRGNIKCKEDLVKSLKKYFS